MIYFSEIERDHRIYYYLWTKDITYATSLTFELKQYPEYHGMWNYTDKWVWDAPDNYKEVARAAKYNIEEHKHHRDWRTIKRKLLAQKEAYENNKRI